VRALAAAVLVAAVAVAAAQADRSPFADTHASLTVFLRQGGVGAEVLIRKGASTTSFGGGLANRQTRAAVRAADHFRVGSITKSFVAGVVLQLVGERKLSLEDTVEQRLRGVVPNGNAITIKELLQHTSGLYDYLDDSQVFAPYLHGDLGHVWAPRQLAAIGLSHPPLFEPGAHWSYSNTNYVLLGLIVEAVTKDTLGNELVKRIIRPLGLHDTTFATGRRIAPPAAHGYYQGTDITTLSGSYAWAAGAIVSTASDLDRFYRALLTGKVVPVAQLKAMESLTPTGLGDSYGLGLLRETTSCDAGWGHNGLVPGYASWALTSKDGRHSAIVLTNVNTFPLSPNLGAALADLAKTAFCDS
jgi:D-alanyl-D-alanine carboxypeptidase